jgi:Ca-activated chloride channel family protein
MNCEETEMLLGQLLFDELEGAVRERVLAHVAECPRCRAKLDEIRAAAGLVKDAFAAQPEPVLSPERYAAIMREVGTPAEAPRRAETWNIRAWLTPRTVGIAAGIILMASAGFLLLSGLRVGYLSTSWNSMQDQAGLVQATPEWQEAGGAVYRANPAGATPLSFAAAPPAVTVAPTPAKPEVTGEISHGAPATVYYGVYGPGTGGGGGGGSGGGWADGGRQATIGGLEPGAKSVRLDTPDHVEELKESTNAGAPTITDFHITGGNIVSWSGTAVHGIAAAGNLGNISDANGETLALTKSGTGTLNLGGANTYTGGTTVMAGTLTVNGGALGTGLPPAPPALAPPAQEVTLSAGTVNVGTGMVVTGGTLTLGRNLSQTVTGSGEVAVVNDADKAAADLRGIIADRGDGRNLAGRNAMEDGLFPRQAGGSLGADARAGRAIVGNGSNPEVAGLSVSGKTAGLASDLGVRAKAARQEAGDVQEAENLPEAINGIQDVIQQAPAAARKRELSEKARGPGGVRDLADQGGQQAGGEDMAGLQKQEQIGGQIQVNGPEQAEERVERDEPVMQERSAMGKPTSGAAGPGGVRREVAQQQLQKSIDASRSAGDAEGHNWRGNVAWGDAHAEVGGTGIGQGRGAAHEDGYAIRGAAPTALAEARKDKVAAAGDAVAGNDGRFYVKPEDVDSFRFNLRGASGTGEGLERAESAGQSQRAMGKPQLGLEARAEDQGAVSLQYTAAAQLAEASPADHPSRADEAVKAEQVQPASVFKAGPVNPWVLTGQERYSTFALDVDTASYALARNYIRHGYQPPPASVRMEEFINNFDYNYPHQAEKTFNIYAEAAPAPFAEAGKNLVLLKVGVQGRIVGREGRKAANLVLVVDSSGSMAREDRMPLVQYALKEMVRQLQAADRVTIVTFGSGARVVLPPTPVTQRQEILATIDAIQCAGSTNMVEGLRVGYEMAHKTFGAGRINRVILCSDGMANIGASEAEELLATAATFREQGVCFTSVGFGMGSYNDEVLQKLADKGDGSYVFVDSRTQARAVFVDGLTATLQAIARDAKIQVEFEPTMVRRFRLIGYEKRGRAAADFRNDQVKGGAVGSGQSSTALYEVELGDDAWARLQTASLGTVYVRYRGVDDEAVAEIAQPIDGAVLAKRTAARDPRFYLAASAAEFAEVLRHSEHARGHGLAAVAQVLNEVVEQLPLDGRIRELRDLVQRADGLPPAP